MILAWLLLLTGLTISGVAIYYSVVGLTAIFSAAAIPIIIMGSALEVGKLVCASWLKSNWEKAPRFMKYYMTIAVVVLMLITSMGIFGFLSKAHNDQTLVSGDVGSKIAIYDEKIKTAKENIESDRKQLKQMDEAVDQIMARSTSEGGADKANAVRKSQARDRSALAKDIETNQKLIASLNDESAPIRAEVRKVEAEVGPIKYIAAFIYGTAPDESMLERAVTWIIILIVIVFDPLAVIMLLAAQMTFAWTKEQKEQDEDTPNPYVADVGEKPTLEEIEEGVRLPGGEWIDTSASSTVTAEELDALLAEQRADLEVHPDEGTVEESKIEEEIMMPIEQWNAMIAEAEKEAAEEAAKRAEAEQTTLQDRIATGESYIDSTGQETPVSTTPSGEEFPENPTKGDEFIRTDYNPEKLFKFDGVAWVGKDDGLVPDFPIDESKKKTYMVKDPTGQIQVKNRE